MTKTYEDICDDIGAQIVNKSGRGRFHGLWGEYSHNIISCCLRIIDKEFGRASANQAVRDMGLKALGWQELPE